MKFNFINKLRRYTTSTFYINIKCSYDYAIDINLKDKKAFDFLTKNGLIGLNNVSLHKDVVLEFNSKEIRNNKILSNIFEYRTSITLFCKAGELNDMIDKNKIILTSDYIGETLDEKQYNDNIKIEVIDKWFILDYLISNNILDIDELKNQKDYYNAYKLVL